ncbi:chemosensory receptor A [Elysia marginata]|uniref:Chemosensory receptor A n=1 Tax=Elysia marginata TaxID=1093978 RepID=A0AAV4K2T1_9GAST|nr:chemosensory receptor A [Elysia marginata]
MDQYYFGFQTQRAVYFQRCAARMLSTENSTAAAGVAGVATGPTTPYFFEFLDERKRKIIEIIMDYVLMFSISVLGVITNTLVIIVYAKQGFRESVAISMTTIALWDLVKCAAGILNTSSGILSLFDPVVAFSWTNITTVVFDYLISFSTYVTSVLAAYVAVERCLCVTFPLKVKWLLTPRVTFIACLTISVVVFGGFAIMFGIYDIVWTWSASFNATVAIYRKNDFYKSNEGPLFAYYNLSGTTWPIASFVVIVIATIIIVAKLREGSKFRAGSSNNDGSSAKNSSDQQKPQAQNYVKRDRQVVKMLLVIIIIYIIALAPRIIVYICKYLFYDFYFLRRGHHMFQFVVYICLTLDVLNGAVNFFVFYKMSSSFRATFQTMATFCKSSTTTSTSK